MPWYVLEVIHGPGHQSGHRRGTPHQVEDYHYSNVVLPKTERDEWFDHLTKDLEWPIGNLKLVKNLPEDICQEKIKEYRALVKSYRVILKELGAK